MQRNGLSAEQADARIRSQMPLVEKAARADLVIDNSADLPALFCRVDHALQHFPQGHRV